jgi:glycosyltransferase involved in cell wall biosynthesis
LKNLLLQKKPDIVHFHNTLPLISPAAYWACSDADVPVIQTLHNYRLLCPGAQFLRNGQICEICLGHALPWPGVIHACYRDSRPATAAVAAMLSIHRGLGTWQGKVNLYIALSEFARRKFIQGGLCGDHIVVKPNFIHPDPGKKAVEGKYALFVGRLSPEKGLPILIKAWAQSRRQIPLRIVGDGPLRDGIEREAKRNGLADIFFMGRLSSHETLEQMLGARFLVVPSVWYEGFPRTIAEAFACGVPVLCSRLGSLQEIVQDGRTGLHFNPGDSEDLAGKVEWAWTHTTEMKEMGCAARAEYEAKYTPEQNYKILMEIYQRAICT